MLGGLAGGAVSGALVNSKKARKTAGTALKIGGLAALTCTLAFAHDDAGADALRLAQLGLKPPQDDVDWEAVTFPEFTPQTDPVTRGLGAWILLAFVAGMILNVMPCMLPVISIKILSFVQQAGEDRKRILQLGLAFAAGIVVVFVALAALAVNLGLSWGEQFQSQEFLVVMIGIVFAFSLSMFGYDFEADHQELTGGDEPRVDIASPDDSLIIYKPTHEDDHGGGERFKKGSWEHQLIRRWIESGARGLTDGPGRIERFDVTPAEIVFSEAGQTAQLKCVAIWEDGTREDVTPLTRFQSNDDVIATITYKIISDIYCFTEILPAANIEIHRIVNGIDVQNPANKFVK